MILYTLTLNIQSKLFISGVNILAALQKYVDENGLVESIEEYQKRRQEYYEKLSTFATFGRVWTRRVNETTEAALKMI